LCITPGDRIGALLQRVTAMAAIVATYSGLVPGFFATYRPTHVAGNPTITI